MSRRVGLKDSNGRPIRIEEKSYKYNFLFYKILNLPYQLGIARL